MNVPNMPDGSDTGVGTTDSDVTDIDVANISKAPKVGVFTFRTFLNIGMLLTESNRAKQLRALVLDIVIDTINAKIDGNTKYINIGKKNFCPVLFGNSITDRLLSMP